MKENKHRIKTFFKKLFSSVGKYISFSKTNDTKKLKINILASVIFVAALALFGMNIFIALGSAVLLFSALTFGMKLSDDVPVYGRFVVLAVLTVITFIIMQTIISCGVFLILPLKFIMNILILLGFVSLFWMVTGSVKISIGAVSIFVFIVGVADHIVVQARSFEIQFSDISAIATAAEVAGGYSFALSDISQIGLALGICYLIFIFRSYFPRHERHKQRTVLSLCSIGVAVLVAITIYTQFAAGIIGYQDKYWKYRGSERNGFLVNIIYSASATRVTEPEGYDAATLPGEINEYFKTHETNETEIPDKRPNVIVVMNETFSDVQNVSEYMGIGMDTNIPVTPFLDSLDGNAPNIIKGHALASVYGGNTANSELEFLSGLSMQFIPRNTVAYNLYLNSENTFSIVNQFKDAGYHTVGMHPENMTNWSRNRIYSYYGFDEALFIDDFDDLTEDDYYRGHVSDKAIYDKVIDLYENKEEGEPLFAFCVTMQNHGGYLGLNYDLTVDIQDKSKYTGIREYLTSINNADSALEYLINYFETADEDTVILFYGDHQPSLSNIASVFYGLEDDSDSELQEAKYAVPYLFWSNRDIECDAATEVTSINFLSSWLLDIVGVEKTDYHKFVESVNREVTALTAMGWFDRDMNFHESDYMHPNLSESLELYSKLQYNALYDKENKLSDFFGIRHISN